MSAERIPSLTTVIIFTPRMLELASFYERALSLPPFLEAGDGHVGQQVGGVYLGFDGVEWQAGQPPSAVTIWFDVPDLPTAFDRCIAAGARVRYPPTRKPWGGYLASLYDPDGNVFGLSENAPVSEPEVGA